MNFLQLLVIGEALSPLSLFPQLYQNLLLYFSTDHVDNLFKYRKIQLVTCENYTVMYLIACSIDSLDILEITGFIILTFKKTH